MADLAPSWCVGGRGARVASRPAAVLGDGCARGSGYQRGDNGGSGGCVGGGAATKREIARRKRPNKNKNANEWMSMALNFGQITIDSRPHM